MSGKITRRKFFVSGIGVASGVIGSSALDRARRSPRVDAAEKKNDA